LQAKRGDPDPKFLIAGRLNPPQFLRIFVSDSVLDLQGKSRNSVFSGCTVNQNITDFKTLA
jgi:hypothetical protein